LKPEGHFGLTAVTFLVAFPFLQVIVTFLATGFTVATRVGVGVAVGAVDSCVNLTLSVGEENPNPYAPR
jgi:hypothetical protein